MMNWRSKPCRTSLLLALVLALGTSIVYSGRFTNSTLGKELVHQDGPSTGNGRSSSSAASSTRASASVSVSVSAMVPPSSSTRDMMLLNAPFYVYEELFWHNATMTLFGGKRKQRVTVSRFLFKEFKHSDDYWFAQNSLIHPMRTFNPAEAKLFVVPILQNTFDCRIMRHLKKAGARLCWNSMCNEQLLEHATKVLQGSPWFRQYPHQHVMVASHYASKEKGIKARTDAWADEQKPASFLEAQSKINVISFEGNQMGRRLDNIALPSTYVGRACRLSEEKSQDVVMIASMTNKFKERSQICEWLASFNVSSNTTRKVRYTHCGAGSFQGKLGSGQGVEQCPALAQAKFGFHVQGDTFGSNRLIDTILSGTVPIFTRKEQYDILPSWIDWEKMSYFINMEGIDEKDFIKEMQTIIQDETGYQRRHEAVLANRQLFDWTSLYPFDLYMYMVQAHLYPETRHGSSDWSVLKLPLPQRTLNYNHTQEEGDADTLVAITEPHLPEGGGFSSTVTAPSISSSGISFIAIVSMQRSSSTYLAIDILAKSDPCQITLNEIFLRSESQSGDAWAVDGKDLEDRKGSIGGAELVQFLLRVAQRRCSGETQLEVCGGTCRVNFKQFSQQLDSSQHIYIWHHLQNLTVVILERDIDDRWRSHWVAKTTGDWTVNGTTAHKERVAQAKVPPLMPEFEKSHKSWYRLVRTEVALGVRAVEVSFDDVVSNHGKNAKEAIMSAVLSTTPDIS